MNKKTIADIMEEEQKEENSKWLFNSWFLFRIRHDIKEEK